MERNCGGLNLWHEELSISLILESRLVEFSTNLATSLLKLKVRVIHV